MAWKIVRGRLPRGLRLDTTGGVLHGTPRARGNYQATLEVEDGVGARARAALRIVVLGSRQRS